MPNNLAQIVDFLIELENSKKYTDAKNTIKQRDETRETLRQELQNKSEMSNNGDNSNYAGLKKRKGNPSYKTVCRILAERCKIPESELNEIIEETRNPQHSLVYGHVEDLNQRTFNFDDFYHFTPQI